MRKIKFPFSLFSLNRQQWLKILFSFIFITGSFNLFLKFMHQNAYVQGWLVDYLLPKIYLSDFFIFPFIILGLKPYLKKILIHLQKYFFSSQENQSQKQKRWLFFSFFCLIIIFLLTFFRQFFTPVPQAAFYQLFKLIEFSLLTIAIFFNRSLFSSRLIFWLATILIVFQSTLGIYQFIAQKPLFSYRIFGETDLTRPQGLPRTAFFGTPKVLPYGTFPHPNILAGVLTLSAFLALFAWRRFCATLNSTQKPFFLSIIFGIFFLTTLTLILTNSFSATLTGLTGLIVYFALPFFRKVRPFSREKITLSTLDRKSVV